MDAVVKFGDAHPEVTDEPFVLLTLLHQMRSGPARNSVQIRAGAVTGEVSGRGAGLP